MPDESHLGDTDAGAVWPWTTFAVHGWFTNDWGQEITIWTAGLDVEVGDRMLIAGEAFTTAVPENVGHSGMAVVCASTEYRSDLDATWQEWFRGTVDPDRNEPEGQADPAAVSEIEASRTRWRELAPATYSAILSIAGDQPIGGSCPTAGSVRIVVTDGIVRSAVHSERGCRLDPSAHQLPTIDELFDQAIVAQAAAVEHGYQLDPTWGFPTSFYGYDRSVELGGGVSWFYPAATTTLVHDEIPSALAAQRARWDQAAPRSYTFILDRLCFCSDVGPYVVTVLDGAPVSITNTDGTPVAAEVADRLSGSVEEVFSILDGATEEHDLVVATFDVNDGHPVNIYIDSIANAIDDEITYVVRELTEI